MAEEEERKERQMGVNAACCARSEEVNRDEKNFDGRRSIKMPRAVRLTLENIGGSP